MYDQTALKADASHDGEDSEPVFNAEDAMNEEEVLEMLLQEGDSDALLVHDFESALSETVQEDPELASAYSAYQIARHKLNEKARNRGFFPSRPFQPSQSKGKGFGSRNSFKGKGPVSTDQEGRSRIGFCQATVGPVAKRVTGKQSARCARTIRTQVPPVPKLQQVQ